MSEDLTELHKKILALIIRENRRPSGIATALSHSTVQINQNEVMITLIDLEKRGLVERSTSKAWTAKGKAVDYIDVE